MSTMTGPDWTTLRPEHFDDRLLPRRHRSAPEGLFSVADVIAPAVKPAAKTAPELDGQDSLFGEAGQ